MNRWRFEGTGGSSHSNSIWNEVALVDDQHDLLVNFLLGVIQDGFAHRSHWVSRVEYVEDDA